MNEEELTKFSRSLTLSEEEKIVCKIEGEANEWGIAEVEHCLVGKVLGPKKVNREAFKTVMEQIWRSIGKVEVEAVGLNMFMFYFSKKEDRDLIWNRGPWHFNNNLIVLEVPKGIGDISKLGFTKMPIWVQLHNAPLMRMNRRVTSIMGSQIGETVKLLDDPKEYRGKFIRVKISVDITKPLKRLLKLDMGGETEETIVDLRYERLPEFCYGCGIVGHESKDCRDEKVKKMLQNGAELPYGSWLRAGHNETSKQSNASGKMGNPGGSRKWEKMDLAIKYGRKPDLNTNSRDFRGVEDLHKQNEQAGASNDNSLTMLPESEGPLWEEETRGEPALPLAGTSSTRTKKSLGNFKKEEKSLVGKTNLEQTVGPEVDSGNKGANAVGGTKSIEEGVGPMESSEYSAMNVSPCKKTSCKWKRAAREKPTLGKVSSPIQKLWTAQQSRRKIIRGKSASPSLKLANKPGKLASTPSTKCKRPGEGLGEGMETRVKRKKLLFEEEDGNYVKVCPSYRSVGSEDGCESAEPGFQARREQ